MLTSGDPAALVLINAVARRIEGVLAIPTPRRPDSFEDGLLDFPHYTRPETVEGLAVPPGLLSGITRTWRSGAGAGSSNARRGGGRTCWRARR